MPDHIWSVLCYKGCLDTYTNQVSLLDVIENISLKPEGPIPQGDVRIPMPMSVVSLWTRSDYDVPETFETRLVLKVPNGSVLATKEIIKADLQSHTRIRTFARLQAFPYQGPGLYKYIVEYRGMPNVPWQAVATIPVDVRVEAPPPEAPVTPTKAGRKRRASRGIAKKA